MSPSFWGAKSMYVGVAFVVGVVLLVLVIMQIYATQNNTDKQSSINKTPKSEKEAFLQELDASRTSSMTSEQKTEHLEWLTEQEPTTSEEEKMRILESLSQ